MNKNDKGFSAVEGLLLLIIAALIGFVGWYVWNIKTEESKNTSTSDSAQEVEDGGQIDTDDDDPVSRNWKRYTSGQGAFSIKLADGLDGTRDTSSDFFIFKLFTSKSGAAVVEDTDGYGSDGFTALLIYQNKKSEMWNPEKTLNLKKTSFVTQSGVKGTKTSYTDPYEPPCEGLGCPLGEKNVMYEFENSKTGLVTRVWYSRRIANDETKRIYDITKDDPDYTEIVDKMVKTLEIY